MKLKLILNTKESFTDYKFLLTTLSTISSIRKSAILRFTDDKITIISIPDGFALKNENDQLWCTIPSDIFNHYKVSSVREENCIPMRINCDSLLNVFKRFDKIAATVMTIKLVSLKESHIKDNTVAALSISFEEYLDSSTANNDDNINDTGVVEYKTSTTMGNTKKIIHMFKVPIQFLYKTQDQKIMEPLLNYSKLMMYKLPAVNGIFGPAFKNFVRRVERYSNVQHIKLVGNIKKNSNDYENNDEEQVNGELRIVVNELDWKLNIVWNGLLEPMIQNGDEQSESQHPMTLEQHSIPQEEKKTDTQEQEENFTIDDSRAQLYLSSASQASDVRPEYGDISRMVEESNIQNEHAVQIRNKDWKLCSKLYGSFEEVVLAIAHDESCILHCSLDRGANEDNEPKQRGQIIYYMARSKPLSMFPN